MTQPDTPTTWQRAEVIADLPAVHEAITALLEDNTGDNATALIAAVLEAQQAAQPVAPVRRTLHCGNPMTAEIGAAQPVAGEPVAKLTIADYGAWRAGFLNGATFKAESAAPAPVGLVPLTDEQIDALRLQCGYGAGMARFTMIVRAIERAHGIKAGKDVAK